MTNRTARLKALIQSSELNITPCCWDALSARLVEQAGFPLAFMSGFGVSASRLGLPDTGQISYGEMLDQAQNIASATTIPIIGDGDTGYGGALNVKRTVNGYARAGMACIMIEDQLSPKRCGHVNGKQVVDRDEAISRLKAAIDARDEGADILILARTDAREVLGLDEALERARIFAGLGADITFVEAPRSEKELTQIAAAHDGPKMVNLLEGGKTPFVPIERLKELGFNLATYPITTLMASIFAQQTALNSLKTGKTPAEPMDFDQLKNVLGFDLFAVEEERYQS
jgi:2-methylisocitrate lyase-like PEP mutase family enzyme